MKRFAKFICFALILAMLLTTPVYAASVQNSRSSAFFTMSSVYLSLVSGNTFKVCFSVTATDIMDELGASVIIVQRYDADTDSWISVRSFYPSTYRQLIDYNQGTHAASVTYTGASGFEYRAYVELYAKNSSGVGYMPEYAYF